MVERGHEKVDLPLVAAGGAIRISGAESGSGECQNFSVERVNAKGPSTGNKLPEVLVRIVGRDDGGRLRS